MTIKITPSANTALAYILPTSDDALLDDLDELVAEAALGDGRAVGAIAIAFGPTLLAEAREELGTAHAQEDADVLQDLFVRLMEGKLVFPDIRHAALPWLKRTTRVLARERTRGPHWDLAG